MRQRSVVLVAFAALLFAACAPAQIPESTEAPSATPADTTAPSGWQRFDWTAGEASLWVPPGWALAEQTTEDLVVDASPQPPNPILPKVVALTVYVDDRPSPGDYGWFEPTFARGDWVELPSGRARHATIVRGSVLVDDLFLSPQGASRLYLLRFSAGDQSEDRAIAQTLRFWIGQLGPPQVSPLMPTPVSGKEVSPCDPEALRATATGQGENGVVNIEIDLTNGGSAPCMLPGLPTSIDLRVASGGALELVRRPPVSPGAPIEVPAGVSPGAVLIAYWGNWCDPPPGPLHVELAFGVGEKSTSAALSGSLLPRCDDPNQRSWLQLDSITVAR